MQFFKLAYTDQKGSARSGSSGEDILHFNAIKIRVVGEGNLKMKLWSLDNARFFQCKSLPMGRNSGFQPTVLANFIEQRTAIEGKTETINEYFRINRIIVYSKLFASERPM